MPIKGTVSHGGHTFQYQEESWGTNRGITIFVKGFQGSSVTYKLSPNPHDLRAYNKNQSKFYEQAATEVAKHYDGTHNRWPAPGSTRITVLTEEYHLVS